MKTVIQVTNLFVKLKNDCSRQIEKIKHLGWIAIVTFTMGMNLAHATLTTIQNIRIQKIQVPITAVGSTQILTVGQANLDIAAVTVTGGIAPLTYRITPALANGLSLDINNGHITAASVTGSPVTSVNHTVIVTDAHGVSANATVILSVSDIPKVTGGSAALTLGQNNVDIAAVTVAGGSAPLTYRIAPALANGLSFNTSTGHITAASVTGPPLSATNYTVTVTDANSISATGTFNLTVNQGLNVTGSSPALTMTQNNVDIAAVSVTGGTAPFTYRIIPALTNNLNFSANTGHITSTSVTGPILTPTNYTVIVTDANGLSANATVVLSVSDIPKVTGSSTALLLNQSNVDIAAVTVAGGSAPLTYSIAPALANGLSFNTSNGHITAASVTGSPLSATNYTVTVTDANGISATGVLNLAIGAALSVVGNTSSLTSTQSNVDIPTVSVIGGSAPLTYSITPALANGLSFNTSNGHIRATTVTGTMPQKFYTVTVVDSLTQPQTATTTFKLTINPVPTVAATRTSMA